MQCSKLKLIFAPVSPEPSSPLYNQAFRSENSKESSIEHFGGSIHLVEKLCGLEYAISPLAPFRVGQSILNLYIYVNLHLNDNYVSS